jgi:hypothetical protein
MRAIALIVLYLHLLPQAKAQDTVYKANGQMVTGKILEYSGGGVDIRQVVNGAKFIKIIKHHDISSIVWQKGYTETVDPPPHVFKQYHPTPMRLVDTAREDAMKYYKGYREGKIATAVISVYPLAGLLPAAIIANIPPQEKNAGCPFPDLMKKEPYRDAYLRQAFAIKRKKTWGGFLVGTGIGVSAVLAVGIFGLAHMR